MTSPPPARGLRASVGRPDERRAIDEALDRTLSAAGGTWLVSGDPGIGKSRLVEIESRSGPASTAGPASAVPIAHDFSLQRVGETWTFQCEGESHTLKNTKGVRLLARLVAEPGREFHVLDLAGQPHRDQAVDTSDAGKLVDDADRDAYRRGAGKAAERARINVQRRIKDAIGRIETLSPSAGRHLQWAVRTGTFCVYDPPRG